MMEHPSQCTPDRMPKDKQQNSSCYAKLPEKDWVFSSWTQNDQPLDFDVLRPCSQEAVCILSLTTMRSIVCTCLFGGALRPVWNGPQTTTATTFPTRVKTEPTLLSLQTLDESSDHIFDVTYFGSFPDTIAWQNLTSFVVRQFSPLSRNRFLFLFQTHLLSTWRVSARRCASVVRHDDLLRLHFLLARLYASSLCLGSSKLPWHSHRGHR